MTADPSSVRVDARVTGVVHGVGFRYFVLREAKALDLVGWVANESDGSVQCVAEGPRDRLETLLDRLRHGPRRAIGADGPPRLASEVVATGGTDRPPNAGR